MSDEQLTFRPGDPSGNTGARDLSAEIAALIEREPGDRVRVTWVRGANYRCNWWAPDDVAGYDNPQMVGLTVTTHRVRKSRFLNVTVSAGKLTIRECEGAGTKHIG